MTLMGSFNAPLWGRISSVKIRACFVQNLSFGTLEPNDFCPHITGAVLHFLAKAMKMLSMEAEPKRLRERTKTSRIFSLQQPPICLGGHCSPREGAEISIGRKWEFYVTN